MSWQARLSNKLLEIRFAHNHTFKGADGIKQFRDTKYPVLKALNPQFPILFRENNVLDTSSMMITLPLGTTEVHDVTESSVSDILAHLEKACERAENMNVGTKHASLGKIDDITYFNPHE